MLAYFHFFKAYGVGKASFDAWRAKLPADFNVVKEGGYYALQQRYRKCTIFPCILKDTSVN
jgi:hypothetical protein